MKAIKIVEVANNLKTAYTIAMKPICRKLGLPHTAFSIIMFLANNPEYCTARQICEYKDIKPNLVSMYVDKMVKKGYMERKIIENDRRQVKLVLTEKSTPVIEMGREVQKNFAMAITHGMTQEEQNTMLFCLEKLNENAIAMAKEK